MDNRVVGQDVDGNLAFRVFGKVNPAIGPEIDTTNNDARVALMRRPAVRTSVIGTGQVIDGPQTKRGKIDTTRFTRNLLFCYVTTITGTPSVTMKIGVAGDPTLAWDDSNGFTQVPDWQQLIDLRLIGGKRKAAQGRHTGVTLTQSMIAAVANRLLRVYDFWLLAETAVAAQFVDTQGTPAALTPNVNWIDDAGLVYTPKHLAFDNTGYNRGIQLTRGADQPVAFMLDYEEVLGDAPVVTAADELIIEIPFPVASIGVELVGSGTAGIDKETWHVLHLGWP